MFNRVIRVLFFSFIFFFIGGCGTSYPLEISTENLLWSPILDVEFKFIKEDKKTNSLLFQEIGDTEFFDTLILSSDYSPGNNISAYVQQEINQIKKQGIALSSEKSIKDYSLDKNEDYDCLLKTYSMVFDKSMKIYFAQFFSQRLGKILVVSYASKDKGHITSFIKELHTIQLKF